MSTDKPTVFHDLPLDAFPFVLQFINEADGTELNRLHVDGPGTVDIPGYAPLKVSVLTTYPDGTVVTATSDGRLIITDASGEVLDVSDRYPDDAPTEDVRA